MNYFSQLNDTIKSYFKILEPDFPKWLEEYIETPALLRSASISDSCGIIYTNLESYNFFYSNLDHSVAVALIVWHFTHDKKQTLAGLFHDIATPAFKHCVDVMNGDGERQESLELLTSKFIEDSKEIMQLLKRDNIKLEEIDNYHIYPIADNDSPRLAADRLEYSFSNALSRYSKLNLEDIRELYNDIEVETNEDNLPELGFKTKKLARKFVKITSEMSIIYRDERQRYSVRLIADILKNLENTGELHIRDLFEKKELEIIEIIEKSKYGNTFKRWREAKDVKISRTEPNNVYWVNEVLKIRYIDPLFNGERISSVCKIAKRYIDKNLDYEMSGFLYIPGIKLTS
ncbi:MAG: HD domain-containing protein [Candidatus Saccharibacteria bacterium]|nr:HD domain-containing protein [Candidatus Saccharibacteria bacterium]